MSTEEMRSFCQSITAYQLRVQVRLKDGAEILEGKVTDVGNERFNLLTDDKTIRELRYSWVARIKNA